MDMIKVENSVITKAMEELGKVYIKDNYDPKHYSYEDLISDLLGDDALYNEVDESLGLAGVIDEDLKNYISANDYIEMLKVSINSWGFNPTSFESNFSNWACAQFQEQLQQYDIDLNAQVDFEEMERMVEDEKKEETK